MKLNRVLSFFFKLSGFVRDRPHVLHLGLWFPAAEPAAGPLPLRPGLPRSVFPFSIEDFDRNRLLSSDESTNTFSNQTTRLFKIK